ncbi:hypothetical protein F5B18DRAFT_441142 [Nemania serpens]|nr:hypothetical protein F5B18DRAFT_441142 [Nemania serpens]
MSDLQSVVHPYVVHMCTSALPVLRSHYTVCTHTMVQIDRGSGHADFMNISLPRSLHLGPVPLPSLLFFPPSYFLAKREIACSKFVSIQHKLRPIVSAIIVQNLLSIVSLNIFCIFFLPSFSGPRRLYSYLVTCFVVLIIPQGRPACKLSAHPHTGANQRSAIGEQASKRAPGAAITRTYIAHRIRAHYLFGSRILEAVEDRCPRLERPRS